MKIIKHTTLLFLSSFLFFMALPVAAQDMRALQVEVRQAREQLNRKARQEQEEAEHIEAESRRRITRDKNSLKMEIARIIALNDNLSMEVKRLETTSEELARQEHDLSERFEQVDTMVRELAGVVASSAKDLASLIEQNGQTGLGEEEYLFLDEIAKNVKFPGMNEVNALHGALWAQIQSTGEVFLQPGSIVDRTGLEVSAELLFVGPFSAMYRTGGETGFLNYSSSGNQLYALNHLPPKNIRNDITGYMDSARDSVPVDISGGTALRQLSYRQSFVERIAGGGPIVWPILAILVIGLIIVFERAITLLHKHHKKIPLFKKIKNRIQADDWKGCEQACLEFSKKPIARVLMAGIKSHHLPREDMENVLQEAILREIPVLERFLSTLGMLVAIAPLLGLLGTVTGMINVFHVITLNGTGDPRLMSGGISQALVTTMLGLGVAIPLMLLHNVLNRTVDRMIAEMEEKGVALVNLIHKQRNSA
ncbi:MotA/TolQ/ExbB proton channel family protein [Desulforhopalus singaporensis]|uniref:Biopolymer transport protein ExbB n=1 Tax=Desulforhopalus singaporensis TaxID=91360 RepID=A0A1H0SIB9_9BACT|nr:MotA/TolQ/ExbB proton channel family protein [Desulforhopalus singaporensis]SDP41562.1 biopolymer transport protein ExbB [Desulforhopalus singaporensis]